MESKSLSTKVGLFVIAGLVIIGALILNFSKGSSFWKPGRTIIVKSGNVGGLRPGAVVTMSGVRVGLVEDVLLSADGRSVLIHCRIESAIDIHSDARFDIEQSGFLGDQYIAIIPTENKLPALKDGDEVRAADPFNLQEAARGVMGLMSKLDATVTKVDSAVGRVDRILLAENALIDLTNTIANFRRMSERADRTLVEVEDLVRENRPGIGSTVSNLNALSLRLITVSDQLGALAVNADSVVTTNKETLRETLLSLRDSAKGLKGITSDLQAGKGAVGALLKDDHLQLQVTTMVGNLNTVSSNVARHGLLWSPKRPTPLTNDTRYSGRGPLR